MTLLNIKNMKLKDAAKEADVSEDIALKPKKQTVLKSLLVAGVLAIALYYILIPALNFNDEALYKYLGIVFLAYFVFNIAFSGFYHPSRNARAFIAYLWKNCRIATVLFCIYLIAIVAGVLSSSVVLRARSYYELMEVENGDFLEEVDSISYDKIPMLDSNSAAELGSRTLGNLSDMVSQFEVGDPYAQINYDNLPVRVAPLKYGNIFKWISNTGSGLPGYILVDMTSQEAEVVRLSNGMRFSPYELFNRDLMRWLRLNYPTYMFAQPHLEIDENGDPYWIAPRIIKRIGLFGGTDITGAVIVDAATGDSTYYDVSHVPSWVDQVFSSELLLEQYEYYGKYASGWLNSVLGQSGVTVTTEGSNFIALNDDVYLYTGITSVGNDQSNVGFILCNMRTKDTKYYEIPGATEKSAQASAQGVVQHLSYTATFPLLLNISNQPTYFMALKDGASLVKLYAMVNVEQYQIVATGNTVQECEANYIALLAQNGITAVMPEGSGEFDQPHTPEATTSISGAIEDIRTTVKQGSTYYYIKLENTDVYYVITSEACEFVVLLNPGDVITVTFGASDCGSIRAAYDITIQ